MAKVKKPATPLRSAYENLAEEKLEFFKHLQKTLPGYRLRIALLDGESKVKARFSEHMKIEKDLLSVLRLAGNSQEAVITLFDRRDTADHIGLSANLRVHIELQYETYWLECSIGTRLSKRISFDGFRQLILMLKALGVAYPTGRNEDN